MHVPRSAPAPVRRSSRLPRGARRAQLLQAAQEVFVAQGFHAAAMDEIADRAGVSKPVLYQHFPGKRELYLALLEQQVTALTDRVREAMEGTDDNRTRVNGAVGAYFDFINADGAAFRLVFESDLRNDDDVRELADRGHRACVEAIGEVIAADTGLDGERALLLGLGPDRVVGDERPVVAAAQGHRVPRRGGVAADRAGLARHLRFPRLEGGEGPAR
jgi:AcrR family transcriptional regulator